MNFLVLLLPLISFMGALVLTVTLGKGRFIGPVTMLATLAGAILMLKEVYSQGVLRYVINLAPPFTPVFYADMLSAIFVLLASLLGLAVSLYFKSYMKSEGKHFGFEVCTLLTLSAVMGVFLSADLYSIILFFEVMTITSFFWVVHRRDEAALKASRLYLYFSVIGGLLVTMGGIFLYQATGDVPQIGRLSEAPTPELAGAYSFGIFLMVVGFGIKAGMFPLHVWLPHAHSAAPTPGSALLSGLLLKIGAYGIIRVGGLSLAASFKVAGLDLMVIILGILTMLAGVAAALLQGDAKKLLAYHSVSQMGYVILGIGAWLFLGNEGIMGLAGAVYHMINHALFKAVLFLGVGVVYLKTKETNLYRMGGLLKSFPITAFLMLLAALGITGTPGLNGYASKTLIHHAVSAVAQSPGAGLAWLEWLFWIVGVGTTASFAKLLYLMFLAKPAEDAVFSLEQRPKRERLSPMHLGMGLLALVMLAIGIRPDLISDKALTAVGINLYIAKDAANSLAGFNFFNSSDLLGMLPVLSLGIVVTWLGLKTGVFHLHTPAWLTIEGLAVYFGKGLAWVFSLGQKVYAYFGRLAIKVLGLLKKKTVSASRTFDSDRHAKLGRQTFEGISADAAILVFTLLFLIAWYIFTKFR